MSTETTTQFFERNAHVFAKWDKYKAMSKQDYRDQFMDLIDYSCTELTEADGDEVLMEVFNTLYRRLGLTVKTQITRR